MPLVNCGSSGRFTISMVRYFTDTSGVLALGNLPERLSATSIVRPIISAATFLLRRFVVSILVRMLVDPLSRFHAFGALKEYFTPSQSTALLASVDPIEHYQWSSRFYPPHCYQLSQAETSSLLRVHLPPRTNIYLEFAPCIDTSILPMDLVSGFLGYYTGPCQKSHPQTLFKFDQVSDVASFCTLVHLNSRIRFAYAVYL